MKSIYEDGSYLKKNPTWDSEHSLWKAVQIFQVLTENDLFPEKIIEIGCGAGGIISELSSFLPGTSFVGYDISPQAIDLARKRLSERVQFVLGDYLSIKSQEFDLAICADVFEHVDDYVGFLKSLARGEKFVVFHVPLDLSLISILLPSILIKTRNLVGHIHYFNEQTALATIKDCGFNVLSSRVTAGCLEFPGNGISGKLFWSIRKVVFIISPSFAARTLGGFSLIVLAKSRANFDS